MQKYETPYVLNEKNKEAGKVLSGSNFDVLNIQLKKGEEIPTHNADANVLIVVRSGVVSTVEGEVTELSSETILQMNPLENHSLLAIEDADVVVIKIK